jgi:hypothetical protein
LNAGRNPPSAIVAVAVARRLAGLLLGLQPADRVELGQRRGQALLALARAALGGRPLPAAARARILVHLAPERLELCTCLRVQHLQPLAPAHRTRLGRGPHPQPVLRHHVQRHQPAVEQRHHAGGQLCLQPRRVLGAEVRQRVVVHPHPAADPAVGIVALAQPVDLARAAHPVDGRPQPQRHQDRRVGRRRAPVTRPRANARVQRAQIQRLHESPHRTDRVIGRNARIQLEHPQLGLIAHRAPQPHLAVGHRPRRLAPRPRLDFPFTEQVTLDLFTHGFAAFGAHAPILAFRPGFVHTF